MQPGELIVAGKREVEVGALQVGPAMAAAVEDGVVEVVDLMGIVRPQHHLPPRIHPRVGPARQQHRAMTGEQAVDELDIAMKIGGRALQVGGRAVGLQLEHMGRQFVRPGDRPIVDIRHLAAAEVAEQPVDQRPDVEAVAVDHHVLDLEAEGGKERQDRRRAHIAASPPVRSTIRRMKASMIRR